jgi:hypothetical protein
MVQINNIYVTPQILPGTGRWIAERDGGAGCGLVLPAGSALGFNRPLHRKRSPSPFRGGMFRGDFALSRGATWLFFTQSREDTNNGECLR